MLWWVALTHPIPVQGLAVSRLPASEESVLRVLMWSIRTIVIIIIPYYARLSTILSSTLVLLFLTKLPCRSVCPEERAEAPREDERERQIWTNLMMKRKLFISSYNSSLLRVSRGSLSSRQLQVSSELFRLTDWLTDKLEKCKKEIRLHL